MNTYMLPVMNPFTKEWFIDNKDGTFSTLSNEEYQQWYEQNVKVRFKTRYDGDELGSICIE